MKSLLMKSIQFSVVLLLIFAQNKSFAQSFLWARGIGSTNADEGTRIRVDASGNVYTVGFFLGTADFNPGAGTTNMTPNGGSSWYDVFITKFDASGNFVWARQVGGTLNDVPFSLELDNSNNLIISGYFNGTVDFDPGAGTSNLTSAGNEDAFVLKLTDQGNFVWAKRVGGAQNDRAHDVAIDASDNVYVAGVFNASGDFDPGAGTVTLTATGQDSYILKLDASGNYVWVRQLTGAGNEVAKGIDVDQANNVITGGNYSGTADFDPGAGVANSTALGLNDIFINKLDASGNFVYNKTIGGTSDEFIAALKTDGNSNIVVVGYFAGSIDVDPGAGTTTATSAGGNDGLMVQLTASGNLNWYCQLASSTAELYTDVDIDASNNVCGVGYINTGVVDFNPGAGVSNLGSSGFEDGFIQRLSSTGTFMNVWSIGASFNNERVNGVATLNSGEIFTTGYFSATFDVDPSAATYNLTNQGGTDIFMHKMGCVIPAAPISTTATANLNICANTGTTLTASGTGVIGWYTAASGGTYLGGGTSFNTGNLAATTSFYIQDSTCAASATRSQVTVTVTPLPVNQLITPATTNICSGGNAVITVGDTEPNAYYSLVNDATDVVVQGPIIGTGNAMNFNLTGITATTTYHVTAIKPTIQNNILDLDGVNDYVDYGTNNRGIVSYATISARVKTAVNGASQFVVSKYLSGGIGYYLLINATGYASIQGRDVAGGIKSSGFSTTMVADNQWHEITGVVRGGVWEIWVDGVMQNSGTYSIGGTGLGTTAPLLVGQFGGTYTPVDIDRLAIWNVALTPALILSNATACLVGNEANMILYATFNESAGAVSADLSPSGLNGTLTNMTVPGCWLMGPYTNCSATCDVEMGNTATVNVVAAPTQPTITPSGSTALCSGGSVTLTSSPGTTYLWSTGATTSSILVSTAGTYTVQVTNSTGCQSVASAGTTVTVGTPPAQPTVSAGGPTTFCSGGSVTLTSSAGTSYLWSTGATTQAINATTSGTYTVQVTNAAGCQSVASAGTTVTVNVAPSQPTISAGGSTTFCSGGSVTLTSSAGTSYLWSTGATTQAINVTTSGTYTVQVTNAAGCQSVASVGTTVTVNAVPSQPTISAGGPTTFCSGGSVTLTSSAGSSYLWSTGATTQSINATSSGTYSVQVTNAVGCQSVASNGTTVTVNASPSQPTITPSGPTALCSGGSVTLTSNSGTSYLWSTGASTQSITVSTAGTYTVQVTNAAGCQSIASTGTTVTVGTPPAQPTVSAGGPTTFCSGGSVTLTSSSGTSYLWSTGATTQAISATTSGTYTVQVTNAAGCQSVASAGTTITVNASPAQPTISAGGPTTFCSGGSVTLTSSAGTNYLWSTGATTQSINVTTSGTYTVQVTNAVGCQSVASAGTTITVNAVPSQPTISAGGPTTFCSGGSVTLTSSAGTSYLWSNGATAQSINVTTSGTYTVQVANAGGCQSVASAGTTITVNAVPSQPTISAGGPTTFCSGGSVTLTSSAGTGYLWSNGATTQSINVTTSGTYTVQVANAVGCQSVASLGTTVTVNALPAQPTISASGLTTFCFGDSVILTASAGNTYLWSGGQTSSTLVITNSGAHTVQVIDVNGCQSPSSASMSVTVNALPVIGIGTLTNPTSCTINDGEIEVTGTAVGDLSWMGAAVGSVNGAVLPATISGLGSGTYQITLTDANGCISAVQTANLVSPNTPATPTISPNGPTTFCSGGSVTLTSSTGTSYLWSNGETTQSIVVDNSGTFTVTIADAGGCSSLASVATSVTVNPIPTASVAVSAITLTASPAGMNYQWINCGNGNQVVNGANAAVFTPSANGSYAVIVTQNGCSDTSSCVTVSTVGIKETDVFAGLEVHPNPGFDFITVTSTEQIKWIDVYTVSGQFVARSLTNQMDVSAYSRGVYLLRVQTLNENSVLRFVKE